MLQVMGDCDLIDLGSTGSKFTWERRQNGKRVIAKRLDKAI